MIRTTFNPLMTQFSNGIFLIACLLLAWNQPAFSLDLTPLPSLQQELRPIRLQTVDARFFDLLDLNAPGLETTRKLVEEKKFPQALNAWRDHVVLKLRKREAGKFGWHSNKLNKHYLEQIKILIGENPAPDQNKDSSGLLGPVGKNTAINWLDRSTWLEIFYPGTRPMDSLVAHYQQTRDTRYITKWFEIVDDFCVNQKRMEKALPTELQTEKLSYPYVRNSKGSRIMWKVRDHQGNLDAAGRTLSILKSLAYLAKALPDGQSMRDWNEQSMLPINTTLMPEAMELIPADVLADIAISLYYDHAPFLMEVYGPPAIRSPNQRFSGLMGMALTAYTFDEFKLSHQLALVSNNCLENYVQTTTLPDGGDLEQSLNYNKGFIIDVHNLLKIFPTGDDQPQWLKVMQEAMLKRQLLFAGISTPLGLLPKIGTSKGGQTPGGIAIWQNQKILEQWKQFASPAITDGMEDHPVTQSIYNNLLGDGSLPPPSFTSIAFPYSGYYAMRDGWKHDSLYLWLIGARMGRGHFKENINGIAITAYGRNLIVDAGPPPYGPQFLPDSQKKDFEKILDYFGEKSSYSTNTVLVDMQSQRRHANTPPTLAYDQPIDTLWHHSDHFDLAESRYEDGYGKIEWRKPAPINVKHHRQVIFLRDAKCWIVTDRLFGDGENHTYQQQWHFPAPTVEFNRSSPGFLNNQVHVDPKKHQTYTNDPSAPNVFLHFFSPSPLKYSRYFGQQSPRWIGWYGNGIGGERVPSVDVHTCWNSTSDSIITTLIAPSPNNQNPVKMASNLSDLKRNLSGYRSSLNNGTQITWLTCLDRQPLQIGNLTATANGLLLLKRPNTSMRGLALGVQSIHYSSKTMPNPPSNFEFSIQDDELRIDATITQP